MLALRTAVFAVVVPEGAQEALRVHGRIVGRTWEQSPRYDVVTDSGTMFRGLRASVIERELDLPRAA